MRWLLSLALLAPTLPLAGCAHHAPTSGYSDQDFVGAIWVVEIPNGDPDVAYVHFQPKGLLGYNYEAPKDFIEDGTDHWGVVDGVLHLYWSDGYAEETYTITTLDGKMKGMKRSNSWEQPRESTIRRVK